MHAIGSELSVSGFLCAHASAYVGDGLVLHNHPTNNEEIISLEKFSKGKEINERVSGVDDTEGFFARVQQVLSQPRPYNVLTNNCEHTTSFVRDGKAHSGQLALAAAAVLTGIVIYVMSRE